MNGSPPKHRTIRFDPVFDEAVARLRTDDPPDRIDEVVGALDWGIGRNAEAYPEAVPGLRIAKTREYPNLPSLRAYFTIDDDDYCTMRYLEEAPLFDEEEDVD